MYIKRDISEVILDGASKYSTLVVVGPAGSGKALLMRRLFSEYTYVSLHNPDHLVFAKNDLEAFLNDMVDGQRVIIDGIDLVPGLISKIDAGSWCKEKLILISSKQMSKLKNVKQYTLLPFSVQELQQAHVLPDQLKDLIYKGFYPATFGKNMDTDWYENYVCRITTDIEDIADHGVFNHFFRLVAGRMGSLLDYRALADDCGIPEETVFNWLSILEQRYIIFLLQPSKKDYGKRLEKKSKLYFYDTGLAAHLLGIRDVSFSGHYLRRQFFESYVISEVLKSYYNKGEVPQVEYWQAVSGNKITILIEDRKRLFPVEVNLGKTISPLFFKGLGFWNDLAKADPSHSFTVYEGARSQKWSMGYLIAWNQMAEIKQKIDRMA